MQGLGQALRLKMNQHGRLAGKVAIITGAGGGIGQATSRLFVEEGAMVVMADIDKDAMASCIKELGEEHTLVHACDVTNESNIAGLVAAAIGRWGHLDIMINNAGIGGSRAGILSATTSDLKEVWAVNVAGVVAGVKEAGTHMRASGRGGCIINMASIAALQGGFAQPVYSITKGAVISLTKSAAFELAPFGIRVNAICPGATPNPRWVKTLRAQGFQGTSPAHISQQLQLQDYFKGPPLTADMIAQSALFLADDKSGGHITAHNLIVDGGLTSFNHYDPFAFIKNNKKL